MKQKLEELNKLVDTIQQSSAQIHDTETFSEPCAVGRKSEPKTRVPQAAPAQKEIEREQRWERQVRL